MQAKKFAVIKLTAAQRKQIRPMIAQMEEHGAVLCQPSDQGDELVCAVIDPVAAVETRHAVRGWKDREGIEQAVDDSVQNMWEDR